MPFDIEGARRAGYADEEIADFLGGQSGFDTAAALKSGYSAGEVISFLSQRPARAPAAAPAAPLANLGDPMGSGAAEIMAAGPSPSVLDGTILPEPQFDQTQALRMSTRSGAEREIMPGDPRANAPSMRAGSGQPVDIMTSRGEALRDAALPVRAVFKAVGGVAEGAGGVMRAAGDLTGINALSAAGASTAQGAQRFQSGMGETTQVDGFGPKSPVPYFSRMAEGAASSLAQSAGAAAALGAGGVIPALAIMTAGQEYDKARTQGLDPADALAGAIPKGAFEAAGEKFAKLDKAMGALGTLLNKGAGDAAKKGAADVLVKAGIREIPGEVFTYLGQTGTDLLPGIGLNPNLTMSQFLDGLRDTVVQAGIMGTAMGGAGAVAGGRAAAPPQAPAPITAPRVEDQPTVPVMPVVPRAQTAPAVPTPVAAPAAPSGALVASEAAAAVDRIAALVGQPAPSPAVAAAAPAVAGQAIDKEWTAFAPESGTLGVPRAEMPQVKAEHRGALVNFLKARGIDHTEETLQPGDVKATQAEFSPAKVAKAREFSGSDRAVLVSSDGHIVDGHHQWLEKLDAGQPMRAIRLNAPIRDLLGVVKEFPSAATSAGATSEASRETAPALVAATPAPALPQQPAQRDLGLQPKPAPGAEPAPLAQAGDAQVQAAGRAVAVQADDQLPLFSRSAKVSVDANVRRGAESMNKALLDKADVQRAMYRNDLGWVDFVWGDDKRGLQHIIKQRMTKDGMSEADAKRLLTDHLVETIARGSTTNRYDVESGTRLHVENDGYRAVLVRRGGSNGWLITGFELFKEPGNSVRGATQSEPSQIKPIRTRPDLGAGPAEIVSQGPSGERRVGFDTSPPTLSAPTVTRHEKGADGQAILEPADDSPQQWSGKDVVLEYPLNEGGKAKLTVDAATVLTHMNERRDALRALKECLA
jgi:phage-Barnase-EndoU-ColicinE5/D-RelE like nuclease1